MNKLQQCFSHLNVALWSILFLCFFLACDKGSDNDEDTPKNISIEKGGLLILNEGTFNFGNASVSYVNPAGTICPETFKTVNERSLGDVGQSMAFYEDKALIVVNNSGKIEVVNRYTFESIQTIEGLHSPRYITIDNERAFVSNIFKNRIDVLDLTTLNPIDSLTLGCTSDNVYDCGLDKMLLHNGQLFVLNWDQKSLLIWDINSLELLTQIPLNHHPTDLLLKDEQVWLMTSNLEETDGTLYQIEANSLEVVHTWELDDLGTYTNFIFFVGEHLYLLHGNLEKLDINEANLDRNIVYTNKEYSIYGYGIAPNENDLYLAIVTDFTQNGVIFKMDLNNYNIVDTLEAGIAPSKFYFVE